MKNISISTFINIIFAVAFFAITLAFVLFINLDKERYIISQHQRYMFIAESLLKRLQTYPSSEDLESMYDQFDVKEVKKRDKKLDIINNSELQLIKDSYIGRMRVYKADDTFYIYVQQLSYNLMLKDLQPKPYNFQIALFIYTLFFITFMMLYILLGRKLRPLKKLTKQIDQFSQGDINVKINAYSNDEIGKIARSFAKALEFIKNQSKSKNLFMRNMMHELKTPITKGMIIAETLPNVRDKEILQNAFERMNNIIKELSTVEKISSNILNLHKEKVEFFHLYTQTLKLMLTDALPITTRFEKFQACVDRDLFCIVLKNLLDNAVKFNTHGDVVARATKQKVEIISHGEPLKNELDYYTEPFSQEEKRSDGFGLGLYIVKTIVDLHGFKFKYTHQKGQNIFTIIF